MFVTQLQEPRMSFPQYPVGDPGPPLLYEGEPHKGTETKHAITAEHFGGWPPRLVNTKTKLRLRCLLSTGPLCHFNIKDNESHQKNKQLVQGQTSESATTLHPSKLPLSSPPLGSQDPRLDQATEISVWQEPAPQAWPTSSNLTPPVLSVDHLFQEPSYKYPLSEMPGSSGTLSSHHPWRPAPCQSNASVQSVCSLSLLCTPSTDWLPKPVGWSLLARPQDCYCKLMDSNWLLKTLINIK